MSSTRAPFELELADGITLRGIRIHGGDSARLVLLHDIGRDLDQLVRLPEVLAGAGCDVIALDLPGHGVSDDLPAVADGTDVNADPAPGDPLVRSVLEALGRLRGDPPLGLVAIGRTATLGVVVGRPQGVEAQVLVDPVLEEPWLDGVRREQAIRLVLHADGTHLAGTATQRFFGRLIGEKMLLHHHAVRRGPAAIADDTTLSTHVSLFLRRYLIAGNLVGGVPDATRRR